MEREGGRERASKRASEREREKVPMERRAGELRNLLMRKSLAADTKIFRNEDFSKFKISDPNLLIPISLPVSFGLFLSHKLSSRLEEEKSYGLQST